MEEVEEFRRVFTIRMQLIIIVNRSIYILLYHTYAILCHIRVSNRNEKYRYRSNLLNSYKKLAYEHECKGTKWNTHIQIYV